MEENTTALSEMNQGIELQDSTQEMLELTDNKDFNELPDYSQMSIGELMQLFQQMLERGDQQELYKNADHIKTAFYKALKKEKSSVAAGVEVEQSEEIDAAAENSDEQSAEVAQSAEVGQSTEVAQNEIQVANNPFVEIEKAFKALYSQYKSSRAEYLANLEREKEENLAKKLEIIEKIKELVENTEDVNSTFPAFRELQNQWKSISMVPQNRAKDLWESYQLYVEKFYDYIKINNEFRDLDFKKNLELKLMQLEVL